MGSDTLFLLGIIVVWIALQVFILPAAGVPT